MNIVVHVVHICFLEMKSKLENLNISDVAATSSNVLAIDVAAGQLATEVTFRCLAENNKLELACASDDLFVCCRQVMKLAHRTSNTPMRTLRRVIQNQEALHVRPNLM